MIVLFFENVLNLLYFLKYELERYAPTGRSLKTVFNIKISNPREINISKAKVLFITNSRLQDFFHSFFKERVKYHSIINNLTL